MTEKKKNEVAEILTMFTSIHEAVKNGVEIPDGQHYNLSFQGFDGNYELKYMFYTEEFKKAGFFKGILDDMSSFNSHHQNLKRYRKMVAVWNKTQDKYNLSKDDLVELAKVKAPLTMKDLQTRF